MRYPLAHVSYGAAEIDAVNEALIEGKTTCGARVARFEQAFSEYVGANRSTMVNSGSSADLLVALGLGQPGPDGKNEVLVPAVTWPTQVWSCLFAGYKVRLVDVDPCTLQMDSHDALGKIDRRTRAIFVTHLLGGIGDLDPYLNLSNGQGLSLTVLEDCCESLGARWKGKHVGTFGEASAFSFFFSHLISTMEGGMVVTNSEALGYNHRLWRSHGWEPKKDYRYWFPTIGFNVRPTELQGAFGVVQISMVEQFRKARTCNVAMLDERTHKRWPEFLVGMSIVPGCEPSWHGFPLMVRPEAPFSRDTLCAYLEEHEIETRPIVAGNLARQPAVCAQADRIATGPLPGADAIHNRGFYIGTPSFEATEAIDYVGEIMANFIKTFTR